jgi:hypothetical protein
VRQYRLSDMAFVMFGNTDEHGKESTYGQTGVKGHIINLHDYCLCQELSEHRRHILAGTLSGRHECKAYSKFIFSMPQVFVIHSAIQIRYG